MSDAAPPRFAIRLHGGLTPDACVAQARAAEAHGFASVWFAENPFDRGVLPTASACAVATERLRIGIGVFNPFNRHPTLMAMEIGALDELAGGRAALGIGSGIGVAVERMGFAYDRPLGAVRDAIEIVRALLRGDTVDHEGRAFSARGVTLDFRPPRPDLPILMAARGDQSLRLCGEIADGLVISNMCPPGFAARAVEIVRQAASDAGRAAPAEVVHYVPCAACPDREEARRLAKEALGRMLPGFWSLAGRFPSAKAALLHSGIPEPDVVAAVKKLEQDTPAPNALDDQFVAAFAIAGTAEDCIAQAGSYATAGVTELALTPVGPDPVDTIAYLGSALDGQAA